MTKIIFCEIASVITVNNMTYCHKCDWSHPFQECWKHGFERNANGTQKSTLSPEDKAEIVRIRENAIRKRNKQHE